MRGEDDHFARKYRKVTITRSLREHRLAVPYGLGVTEFTETVKRVKMVERRDD